MRKQQLLLLVLLTCCLTRSGAQDLTVHVLDQNTKMPVADALVRLHYGCWHSVRPVELKQKTDASGIVVFHSLSIGPREFCVFPDYTFEAQVQQFAFTSPEVASTYGGHSGHVFSSLPGDVTFHVRRLSLSERIRNFLRYD